MKRMNRDSLDEMPKMNDARQSLNFDHHDSNMHSPPPPLHIHDMLQTMNINASPSRYHRSRYQATANGRNVLDYSPLKSYGSGESTAGSTCGSSHSGSDREERSDISYSTNSIGQHRNSRRIHRNRGIDVYNRAPPPQPLHFETREVQRRDHLRISQQHPLWHHMQMQLRRNNLNNQFFQHQFNSHRGKGENYNKSNHSKQMEESSHFSHLSTNLGVNVQQKGYHPSSPSRSRNHHSNNGNVSKSITYRHQSLSPTPTFMGQKGQMRVGHMPFPTSSSTLAEIAQFRIHCLNMYALNQANLYHLFVIPVPEKCEAHILPKPPLKIPQRVIVEENPNNFSNSTSINTSHSVAIFECESDAELDNALELCYQNTEENLCRHAEQAHFNKQQAARRATEAWLAGQSEQQREAYIERTGLAS